MVTWRVKTWPVPLFERLLPRHMQIVYAINAKILLDARKEKGFSDAEIRSISLIVDITNYVMIELGQPIHGYDLDTLTGGLIVRRAQAGEKLVTLDDVIHGRVRLAVMAYLSGAGSADFGEIRRVANFVESRGQASQQLVTANMEH